MIKRHSILTAILLCFVAFTQVMAQEMQEPEPLPIDPKVRYGKLSNGLTYYIRHNDQPKDRADFYIAQNVGSILEEDNQRGLAHFLEHMAFDGSRNFPNNGMDEYIESVGMRSGENFNAYTSFDETVYMITNAPVNKSGVVDSCLLILHDWSGFLALTDSAIQKERGVIREEWRTRQDAQTRLWEQQLPKMYPGSRYANRMPIGSIDVIENFKPDEYWNIDALLHPQGEKGEFTARLAATADGKKLTVTDKQQADAVLAALDGKDYTITKIEKGKRRRQPAPPFITSTLQQDASRAFGFSATRTMRAAQTLYEGVDIAGHGTVGLITYMRTDSLRIAAEAQAAAKTFIADRWGEGYVCKTPRKWKSRSATAAQDAHEAIRPSMPELTPDEVEQSISGDTAKLYRLIWSRFMASQMADCIQDTVSASITAGEYLFRASGFRVSFDGFTALYEESTDDTKKKETALPPLEEGQKLALKKLTADQKFTQPPPLYTEATLIHALEENGIGRPSTYAPIITTIVDRGYVEKDQKKLKTTPLGQAVNTVMMEQFPDIVNVKFSADMEKKLDVVEAGEADWVKTIDEFYQGFEKSLEQAEKNMEGKKVKVPDEPSSEVCDLCGRPMVIKVGKYGKFLACSGFPECRGTKRLVKDTGGICPKCGKGRMLERKSAKGRIYYGCERYPDCDFMTWDMPVAVKCEKCGSTLFRKGSKLYCAKEGCDFEMPVPKKD